MDRQAGRETGSQKGGRSGGRAVGRSGGHAGKHYETSSHFPSLRTRLHTNKMIFSEVVHLR